MHYDRLNIFTLAVLLACFLVGHTANVAVDEPESFCLRHTGLQDKPLPTICFVQNEAASHSPSSENYRIDVETSETETIEELARSFDEPVCLGEYGSYATIRPPEAVICRKNMKIFLQAVKRFANPPTSSSIEELLSRI